MGLLLDTLEIARNVGGRIFYFGGDLSPMLVAVGFIVRLNVAVLIFIGGAMGWLIGIPLFGGVADVSDPVSAAYGIWSSQIRYVGVGAMVMGGISSLFSVRAGLMAAIRELRSGLEDSTEHVSTTSRDIPTKMILAIGCFCVAILVVINYQFTGGIGDHRAVDGRDAGHGVLLHGGRQLHRGTGRQLEQSRLGNDDHGRAGRRRHAVAVQLLGSRSDGRDVGCRRDRLLRRLHSR